MKRFTNIFVLFALFTIAFSWAGFFESFKDKEESIKNKLGMNNLKDASLNDLAHSEASDIKSKLEKLKSSNSKESCPSHHKDIDEFWTGAFEALNLPKPVELINCFGKVSEKIFFAKIRTINNLLMHSRGHDMMTMHASMVQLEAILPALEPAHKCVVATKDFERVASALDLPRDLEALKNAEFIYYQAKFDILFEQFKTVYHEVEAKNYNQAGINFGNVFKKAAAEYKKQGEDLITFQAFSNGLSEGLSLPLPSQRINCYTSKDAKLAIDFFRGWSRAVAEGTWYKADSSVSEYWEKEGKSLLEKIDKKVIKCDMDSNESKHLNDKLGVDISSKEFRDQMSAFIKDHNIKFYTYLRTMNSAFEKNDYFHGAGAYAQLLSAIAKPTKEGHM